MPASLSPSHVSQRRHLFAALHSMADEIHPTKTAGVKAADGAKPSDPGGYQGASTHPSADADNHGENLQTGSRSSENTSDVKADQGAPGVDSTPEGVVKDQDSVQLNIGTNQSATGEDSSVEDDYKGDKDDPGTSHPMKATIGEKYSSLKFAEARAKTIHLGQEILADIAVTFGRELVANVKVAGQPVAPPAAAQPTKSASATPPAAAPAAAGAAPAQPTTGELLKKANAAVQNGAVPPAVQAGYELAAALGVKQATAMAGVSDVLANTLRDADLDAELVGAYLKQFKTAADDTAAGEGEDHDKPGDGESGEGGGGGGGGSSGGGGGESGGSSGGGGGGGGGGGSLGDMLGGGADPGGLLGGGGGGGGGGAMGGGVSQEQALQQLVSALAELGIPIEALAQAGGGGGGMDAGMGGGMGGDPLAGGGGGAPPPMAGGGGAPPPAMGGGGGDPLAAMAGGGAGGAAPPMSEGMKLASVAKAFQRSGKFRFKEAADGTPERQLRDDMKAYVLDLMKTAERKAA